MSAWGGRGKLTLLGCIQIRAHIPLGKSGKSLAERRAVGAVIPDGTPFFRSASPETPYIWAFRVKR